MRCLRGLRSSWGWLAISWSRSLGVFAVPDPIQLKEAILLAWGGVIDFIGGIKPAWLLAFFAFLQWRISRGNLRLGLYGRRFEIYSAALDLKRWLDAFSGDAEGERIRKEVVPVQGSGQLIAHLPR